MMKSIKKPSLTEVEKYLYKCAHEPSLKRYLTQEDVVVTLFRDIYPYNTKEEEILVKVQILNLFYSTGIINTYAVAKHIYDLKDTDKLLQNADIELIENIANITIKGKRRRFYSFATKYCCHHNPNQYPIFDNNVCKILIYFNKIDNFYNFKASDLKNYGVFKNVIQEFQKYYDLEKYSFRELDWYLWLLGKEHFSPSAT